MAANAYLFAWASAKIRASASTCGTATASGCCCCHAASTSGRAAMRSVLLMRLPFKRRDSVSARCGGVASLLVLDQFESVLARRTGIAHAGLLHDALRGRVLHHRDGDDQLQTRTLESESDRRDRGFGRDAAA